MGAGTRPVFHVPVGQQLHPPARIARSRRKRAERRIADRALWKRHIHLHRIRLLSTTTSRSARSGAPVCEFDWQSLVSTQIVILSEAKDLLFPSIKTEIDADRNREDQRTTTNDQRRMTNDERPITAATRARHRPRLRHRAE